MPAVEAMLLLLPVCPCNECGFCRQGHSGTGSWLCPSPALCCYCCKILGPAVTLALVQLSYLATHGPWMVSMETLGVQGRALPQLCGPMLSCPHSLRVFMETSWEPGLLGNGDCRGPDPTCRQDVAHSRYRH